MSFTTRTERGQTLYWSDNESFPHPLPCMGVEYSPEDFSPYTNGTNMRQIITVTTQNNEQMTFKLSDLQIITKYKELGHTGIHIVDFEESFIPFEEGDRLLQEWEAYLNQNISNPGC